MYTSLNRAKFDHLTIYIINKNIIGFALIIAGALDLILWLAQGYGWTELIFGVGVLSSYSWGILIAAGFYIRNQHKAELAAELQVAQLEEGEEVIFTDKGTAVILTLTSTRLMFAEIELDDVRKNSQHIPSESAGDFLLKDIQSVSKVKSSDVSNNALGKKINLSFGIQLITKNGVVNLPTKKADILIAHMTKYISS